MVKKGRDRIFDFFEDRKATLIIGPLCMLYFVFSLLPESKGFIANILPPIAPWFFAMIGFVVFVFQALVWHLFKLFHKGWGKDFMGWIFFLCEFAILLFGVGLLSWPFYAIWQYFTDPNNRAF